MEIKNEEKANLLIGRAIAGDPKALRKLERVSPDAFELMLDGYADLGRQTQTALIEAIYLQRWGQSKEGDLLAVASVERQAEELRKMLFEVHTTPLERIMADRVVTCWLALCWAEMTTAQQPDHLSFNDDRFERWLDRCAKRFSIACKDLATVHRLLAPSVQINVAKEQQIANIFATHHEADGQRKSPGG